MINCPVFQFDRKANIYGYEFPAYTGGIDYTYPDFINEMPGKLRRYVTSISNGTTEVCPFCNETMTAQTTKISIGQNFIKKTDENGDEYFVQSDFINEPTGFMACLLCGFWYNYSEIFGVYDAGMHYNIDFAVMREFDINDAEVAIPEVVKHLSRRYSDIYNLAPRKFEKVVADVFRDIGYDVRLTQQSWDDGYDLVLLERTSSRSNKSNKSRQVIVEIKRYRRDRTVGIHAIRNLFGVQVYFDISRAKLVTSSRFTKSAMKMAQDVNDANHDYSLELVDADALAKMLQIYRLDDDVNLDDRFSDYRPKMRNREK